MPTVTVGQEDSADIEIHYSDHGAGLPVVLIRGYSLSGRAGDKATSGIRRTIKPALPSSAAVPVCASRWHRCW
jgi:hypothetical protein